MVDRHPSLRGTVIQVYMYNGVVTGVYVHGKLEADTSVAQAFVRISDKTRVFIKHASGPYQPASLTDLTKGDMVEILFAALVEQASPEPPIAEEIVIVK